MTIRTTIAMLAVVAAGVGLTGGPVSAQDLRVALAAGPTSMDPHYQNLTINNSMAMEVYDALVLQDVNQNLVPGLALSWEPIDERTWEFRTCRWSVSSCKCR